MEEATFLRIPEEDQQLVGSRTGHFEAETTPVRMTIGEFARKTGVTLRALRFYQSKGLIAPQRNGTARSYSLADLDRLAIILQGKRLGFTLHEIREMLAARARGCNTSLPISRKKCIEQIKLLERQRRDVELALAELRQIHTGMFKAALSAPSIPGQDLLKASLSAP